MAIITLHSGSFCHADAIAAAVTGGLNYTLINDTVFEETSRRFSVPRENLRNSLVSSGSLLGRFTSSREKHVAWLRLVLAESIQSDNVVIEGCLGHLIPRTIGHLLKVCIIANHEYRVAMAMKSSGLSEKEATRAVHESDKQNFACTEFLFEKNAYDESLFDIVLPMHDRQVADAVGAICRHASSEAVQTTDRSNRAARDFILSAQVGVKLAEEGLTADVHAENGNVILSVNKNVVRLSHYRENLAKAALQVPGVKEASTRLGPRYKPASSNPWSKIEGPPKIMLVDDEKEFVHTLSERLRTRQLESSIAYDGEQALAMAQEETPDVIVLDLMMPGIDGIETLRRLKRDHPEVEVIILTGHGSETERREAEELGAFAYLRKPVDIDALARVMRDAYNQSGSNRTRSGMDEGE